MTLIFETNNQGFMCWIAEMPGAFVRGTTRDEVYRKLDAEIIAYAEWLGIPVLNSDPQREELVTTNAIVQDGDTNVLLEADKQPYGEVGEFDRDCRLMRVSAQKVQQVYDACGNRDAVTPRKNRSTFYGHVHATIDAQYKHVVGCQQYYLENIGLAAQLPGDLLVSRAIVVDEARAKYLAEGNRLYCRPGEDWTLRKVVRRIIWHDRIHGRAIIRMDEELCT